jgi:hypothetical protein
MGPTLGRRALAIGSLVALIAGVTRCSSGSADGFAAVPFDGGGEVPFDGGGEGSSPGDDASAPVKLDSGLDSGAPLVPCSFPNAGSRYGVGAKNGDPAAFADVRLGIPSGDSVSEIPKIVLRVGAEPSITAKFVSKISFPQYENLPLRLQMINGVGDAKTTFVLGIIGTGDSYGGVTDGLLNINASGNFRVEFHGTLTSGRAFVSVCDGPQAP